jgi:hypothetical protein
MNRKEAIALLSELGAKKLVSPDFVIVEERNSDTFQLKIKGSYNIQDVKLFLKERFSFEEIKDYLIIFKLLPT